MSNQATTSIPRVGMLPNVRNHRGIVSSVEPFGTPEGNLHLVRLDYIAADGTPDDAILWEQELNIHHQDTTALPRLADRGAMPPGEFDALQRAARWSALSPYLMGENALEGIKTLIAAPLFGAIQAEDFQLMPLLKALQMPRVTLLLADDVGLGKTIEAGLILTELLLRRRIRRVLILCPASLRTQWKSEIQEKFPLGFEVIDRNETHPLQKRLVLTPPATPDAPLAFPTEDVRWVRFLQLIQDRLPNGDEWIPNERLIVFTEYKTALDHLIRRPIDHFGRDQDSVQGSDQDYAKNNAETAINAGRIRMLFGGMDDSEQEAIKQAFNDPTDPVRILVATDAASGGLNLQETALFVLHYDIPFNPARLDQRNGCLDRHGQARYVVVFHFTSKEDADLRFLAHVVDKVNVIREELGSMGEVFDAAFERQFSILDDADAIVRDLDAAIAQRQGRTSLPTTDVGMTAEHQALEWLAQEIDLSPQTLAETLEQAMSMRIGLPRFEEDAGGRIRLRSPLPRQWESLIDDTLRLPIPGANSSTRTSRNGSGQLGALPALTFDPGHFVDRSSGRSVFRSARDTVLLHLGHPVYHKALAFFARARFPTSDAASTPSRWTVRYGDVPDGTDALLLLTVEELAVSELRESFHHWMRTGRIPIVNDQLGESLPHLPAAHDQPLHHDKGVLSFNQNDALEQARDLWDAVEFEARDLLKQLASQLTADLEADLKRTRNLSVN